MARLFYLHWNKDEVLERVEPLRAVGHVVSCHSSTDVPPKITAPPDVFIVSLARLPSHGRAFAQWTRERKDMREVPLVFVDGTEEKVQAAREKFPGAVFCTSATLPVTVRKLVVKGG
jgi:hypothetical protein